MRDLKGLPKETQKILIAAIEDLQSNPRPHGVEKLRGHPDYLRIREGDYRIIYALPESGLVVVCIIKHRSASYKHLGDLNAKLAHALREILNESIRDFPQEVRVKA